MSNTKQRVVTAFITLVVAAGAGHVTQYGLSGIGAPSVVSHEPAVEDTFTPLPSRPDNTLLKIRQPLFPAPTSDTIEHVVPAPAAPAREALRLPALAPVRIAVPAFAPGRPPNDDEINLNGFGIACGTEHGVSPELGGLIRLRVMSACDPGMRVDVTYAGLSFSGLTDAQGLLDLSIPAVSEQAEVTYRIGDGTPVTASVSVPDVAAFTRVALAWPAGADVSLHALEFGAGPGSEGHVTHRRAASPKSGGRVVRLGTPELADSGQVEFYSLPSGPAKREGTIRLTVSARVTDETCGGPLDLVSVHATGEAAPLTRRHAIPVPDCANVGDILVLKNILDDLKIAAN